MRTALWVILIGLSCTICVGAERPADWMVELTLDGRRIEGAPVSWNSREVHLLGRDGRLWQFEPDKAADYRRTSNRFRAYSVSELRAELLRELGHGFQVTGTGHYLVAHPPGKRDQWAERFEDLYRSFIQYFSVRGFRLSKPPFLLIAVVCHNQEEFLRLSARQGLPASPGVLGWYAHGSNRVFLYDVGAGADNSHDWKQNASTAIHEATHQTAFNTGVHSRYVPTPVWVAEGLATNFEAPGVYDSRNHPLRADRVNRGRFDVFRQSLAPRHKPELLASLIASDQLFRVAPGVAYAEAWALTFYLLETQPRKYANYLKRTVERPPFQDYTTAERVADFTAVFGSDWRMLEARFLRFMAQIE